MKNVFLVYNSCCFYEIIILNYFMKVTGQETVVCSLDGNPIICAEGYTVNVDMELDKVKIEEIKSFIIPGGDTAVINNEKVHEFVAALNSKGILISGICAGVGVLKDAGILKDIKSTDSLELDICVDKNIITARANAYVDFAIETGKKLDLFEDEADLQETIDFWKYHMRID